MKHKLTKRWIEKLEPGDTTTVVWDAECAGLVLVVAPGGTKSYAFDYRTADGRRRRYTFARHPAVTPTEARETAGDLRTRVSAGGDPLAKRETAKRAPTLGELAEKFIADHGSKRAPRTVAEYRAHFENNIIPHLGANTPLTEVAWEDVAAMHSAVSRRAPVRANRALAVGSVAWGFARRIGWVSRAAPNPFTEHVRNDEDRPGRALERGELSDLGAALAADSSLAARGLELVLLTGCRPGELRTAKWEKLDGRLLHLPQAKTGKRAVFVGAVAAERLEALPRLNEYIVGSPDGGPYYDWSAAWNRAREESGVDCRTYDLRHTFTTTAAAVGVAPENVRILVGHAPGAGAHRRYLHPERHPDLRDRLLADADRVAAHLSAGLRGELPAKGEVVEFPGVRG